jgi:C-terminal peptidase prc
VFRDIWETIRDNYLYRDYNGLDWDAVYAEYLAKVEAGLTPEAFYLAMSEMVFRLGDEHSAYLSPLELAEEQAEFAGENDFVGIGVYSTTVAGKSYVTVIAVFPGSPAEQAGIRFHDNILEVEGLPLIEGDLDRRSTLLGEEGTSVEITVQTPGEEPRQLTLTRRRVQSPLPVPYSLLASERGKRIGYLMLPTFADETIDRQVGEALQALGEGGRLDGLIIDNRFNNGGINTVTADTLGYFASGVVGYFVNRQGDHGFNVFGRDINGSLDLPLAVLVGPDTASFGEIFSGVLQDLGRASIVGETTNGNVEVLWGYDFEDGSRLWLAHDTFRPLNNPDLDWEQTGIIPDVIATGAWDEYTLETDPVVRAAQDLLEGVVTP